MTQRDQRLHRQFGDRVGQWFVAVPAGDVGDALVADEFPLIPTKVALKVIDRMGIET